MLDKVKEWIEIVRKGRKEVTWYKEKADEYNEALDGLLNLGQSVIDVQGMPEKKTRNNPPYDEPYNCGEVKGFNEALNLCTLFLAKEKLRWEENNAGKVLYMDLCGRLIKRILEFNPDEHDIELNLCGIIAQAAHHKAGGK